MNQLLVRLILGSGVLGISRHGLSFILLKPRSIVCAQSLGPISSKPWPYFPAHALRADPLENKICAIIDKTSPGLSCYQTISVRSRIAAWKVSLSWLRGCPFDFCNPKFCGFTARLSITAPQYRYTATCLHALIYYVSSWGWPFDVAEVESIHMLFATAFPSHLFSPSWSID